MNILKCLKLVKWALVLSLSSSAFADDTEWQQKALLEPPEYLLVAEAGGRVMIYDGLPIEIVDRAMDNQFDRIEHMMFTRIRHKTPEGEQVEDDGC